MRPCTRTRARVCACVCVCEKETERQTETDRQIQRQRQRQRDRETERESERNRVTAVKHLSVLSRYGARQDSVGIILRITMLIIFVILIIRQC